MQSANAAVDFGPLALHLGLRLDPVSGAVMTPIVLSSTFVLDGPGVLNGWDYSRAGNPTRDALELCHRRVGRVSRQHRQDAQSPGRVSVELRAPVGVAAEHRAKRTLPGRVRVIASHQPAPFPRL